MATTDQPPRADPCAQWRFEDGVYLLGALSPAERHAFEGHLIYCARCRDNLAFLAVLPGLLARVPADRFGGPANR
jgi:hypothetical protein